jgi:TolB protein
MTRTRFVIALALAVFAALPSVAAAASRSDGAKQIPIKGLKGSLQNPCFSPDSKRIALTQWTAGYNVDEEAFVHVADVASGRRLARIGEPGTANVNMPGTCWNAATDRIAFSGDVEPDQVFLAPPSGADPRQVTKGTKLGAIEPTISPDGTRIVFESHEYDTDKPGELWTINADGTGLKRITKGADDRQPAWSPAGDKIVFQRQRRKRWDIWTVNPDGSGLRNVTNTKGLDETDVSFSPSGKWIVFSGDGEDVDIASLFTIGADGKGRARLTRARGYYDGAPGWSPDSKTIAFESRKGDPDGSSGTKLWTIAAPAGRS